MTTEAVRAGERMIVTLPCPGAAGLRLSGEVAYRIEIGFGVGFLRKPEAARVALTLLLAEYCCDLERLGGLAPRAEPHPASRTTL